MIGGMVSSTILTLIVIPAVYGFGRGEETETHVQEAFRLSPRDTNAHLWIAIAGLAKLYMSSDEEAVARCRVVDAGALNKGCPG
jgi:hypothetical protein